MQLGHNASRSCNIMLCGARVHGRNVLLANLRARKKPLFIRNRIASGYSIIGNLTDKLGCKSPAITPSVDMLVALIRLSEGLRWQCRSKRVSYFTSDRITKLIMVVLAPAEFGIFSLFFINFIKMYGMYGGLSFGHTLFFLIP